MKDDTTHYLWMKDTENLKYSLTPVRVAEKWQPHKAWQNHAQDHPGGNPGHPRTEVQSTIDPDTLKSITKMVKVSIETPEGPYTGKKKGTDKAIPG